MDNIVENILAIDRAATEIIKKAESARQLVLEETIVERNRLLGEAEARLNEKVEEFRSSADEQLKEKIKLIEQDYIVKQENLKKIFDDKSASIEDEIVSRLIGREE